MSDLPTPDEVDEATQKARMSAALTREHYNALLDMGFAPEEAFELTENYHWALIGGNVPEEDV